MAVYLYPNTPSNLARLESEVRAALTAWPDDVDMNFVDPITGDRGIAVKRVLVTATKDLIRVQCPNDVPKALVDQVIAAHDPTPDPPPKIYFERTELKSSVRTVGTTPGTVFRATLHRLTGYTAALTLIGVDAGNGVVKVVRAVVSVKRLNAGAVLISPPTVLSTHADTGAESWAIAASVSGNDFLITVTGAANRTIDWQLSGEVINFTPGGR